MALRCVSLVSYTYCPALCTYKSLRQQFSNIELQIPALFPVRGSRNYCSRWVCFSNNKGNPGSLSRLHLQNEVPSPKKDSVCAVYLLLLLNLGVYVADHVLKVNGIRQFYLYHDMPKWYQFATATFCHYNWSHLSSNLFFLYMFGKLVEEEEGGFALWISYLVTGIGANIVSWLFLPGPIASVGASGAVFGLFAISVLVKLSWDWRKIIEVFVLGQFVLEKVMEEAVASTRLVGQIHKLPYNINHIAHLAGALIGAALIWVLSGLPSTVGTKQLSSKKHPQSKE